MKFLPKRAAIDTFGNGGFRFAGLSHLGSLLVLPSGMRAWSPAALANLKATDFAAVVAEKALIDVLVIGTGAAMARPPRPVLDHLAAMDVRFDFMSTSSAIHTYNLMLGEDRRVAAALLAVGAPHE